MARTGTAWRRAPPLISFDYTYRPFLPSVNFNFSLFLIDHPAKKQTNKREDITSLAEERESMHTMSSQLIVRDLDH